MVLDVTTVVKICWDFSHVFSFGVAIKRKVPNTKYIYIIPIYARLQCILSYRGNRTNVYNYMEKEKQRMAVNTLYSGWH